MRLLGMLMVNTMKTTPLVLGGREQGPRAIVRMGKQGIPKYKRDGLLQAGIKSYCVKSEINKGGGGIFNEKPVFESTLNVHFESESETLGPGAAGPGD